MQKKLSLYQSAVEVERMMDVIDSVGALEEQIIEDFKSLREANSDAVDRCLYRLGSLDMFIAQAQSELDAAKAKLGKLKAAKEKLETHVMNVLKSVSFPLKGKAGEFTTKEGAGKVAVDFPLIESKTYTNIIPDNAQLCVPQKFMESIHIFRLRKDDLRAALLRGERFDFVTLVKEERLEWKKSMKALL